MGSGLADGDPPAGVHWLRFALPGLSHTPVVCTLVLDQGWEFAELFQPPLPRPLARSGWRLPAEARSLPGRDLVLPVTVPPGGTEVLLPLECQRAARTRTALAVIIFADVDHFKAYNDALGHAAGDQVLSQVGQTLRRVYQRAVDTVARLGGEEFTVVLPDTPLEQATRLGEQLRVAVANLAIPHPASPNGPHLTMSVGVAGAHPPAADGASALLATADQALYRAKDQGRNCIEATVLPPAQP